MPTNAPTFDHMPVILFKRDVIRAQNKEITGGIYFTDDYGVLVDAIHEIKDADTCSVKIGILYRAGGHTTPILVEKIVPDDEDQPEEIIIYNTDSTALDVDDGDLIRKNLKQLTEDVDGLKVYCLAYHDPAGSILLNCKRQHDKYSCATFSLLDLEKMLIQDTYDFFKKNSAEVPNCKNLFTISALPASFMYVTQSLEGKQEGGVEVRRGLRSFREINPQEAKNKINIFGTITSFENLTEDVNLSGILNGLNKFVSAVNNSFTMENLLRKAFRDFFVGENLKVSVSDREVSINQLCTWFDEQKIYQNRLIDIHNEFYFGLYNEGVLSDFKKDKYDAKNITEATVFDLAKQQFSQAETKAQNEANALAKLKEKSIPFAIGLISLIVVFTLTESRLKKPSKVKLNIKSEGIPENISDFEMACSAFGQGSYTAAEINGERRTFRL